MVVTMAVSPCRVALMRTVSPAAKGGVVAPCTSRMT